MEKCCSMCKEVKEVTEFHKDARKTDGLRSNCKSCVSAYQKARYARKREAELLLAEEEDMMNMFRAEAQISEPVLEETIQMSQEVAQLLEEVKTYTMQDKPVVKAIELRKAIQKRIGKIAKNVKKVFAEEEVLHFEDKAMKDVFGVDWKPSRHGYIVLDMKQAIEFTEQHLSN
ncbi:hypothetical protein M3225_26605 [Priestia aryabhattai]|uniref:hypothetical protein n=1 Tax=Priestia aryabhattai TaxID=412384 RepID=UPI002041D61F|nr:hypothetical protein [Priestia aryabhattai]MCM3773990.1 hypothetical protein [Priestia aryabhattai]